MLFNLLLTLWRYQSNILRFVLLSCGSIRPQHHSSTLTVSNILWSIKLIWICGTAVGLCCRKTFSILKHNERALTKNVLPYVICRLNPWDLEVGTSSVILEIQLIHNWTLLSTNSVFFGKQQYNYKCYANMVISLFFSSVCCRFMMERRSQRCWLMAGMCTSLMIWKHWWV